MKLLTYKNLINFIIGGIGWLIYITIYTNNQSIAAIFVGIPVFLLTLLNNNFIIKESLYLRNSMIMLVVLFLVTLFCYILIVKLEFNTMISVIISIILWYFLARLVYYNIFHTNISFLGLQI